MLELIRVSERREKSGEFHLKTKEMKAITFPLTPSTQIYSHLRGSEDTTRERFPSGLTPDGNKQTFLTEETARDGENDRTLKVSSQ